LEVEAMPFTDTDLRRVRAEVGSQPTDDDLADAWDAAGEDGVPEAKRWAAVAYQVVTGGVEDAAGPAAGRGGHPGRVDRRQGAADTPPDVAGPPDPAADALTMSQ
jgi:hypothetical protein